MSSWTVQDAPDSGESDTLAQGTPVPMTMSPTALAENLDSSPEQATARPQAN